MQTSDVNAVVDVHLQAFQGFFLSFLGRAFLRELYLAVAADPSRISYVYEESGRLRGFVVGTDEPPGFYRRLLNQRWWRFGLASVGAVLRRPAIVLRLVRALHMPHQVTLAEKSALLMSIAVAPDMQGRGIGRSLVETFLQEAAHRNLKKVVLTTDRLNNDTGNSFYCGLGFTCARAFVTPEGRAMNEYEIIL